MQEGLTRKTEYPPTTEKKEKRKKIINGGKD